ncbi:MAG: PASTA domain-containing protein [Cyclobacteriaceae bacterium]|nr:PASTA domain-containing protein [Cyclobacteriaceae bacterium]
MKFKFPFQGKTTLGSVIASFGLAIGIILLLGVAYFYVYLPNSTNHGEEIPIPDLTGKSIAEIETILTPFNLRYEIGDSAYSASYPPLTVLQQFPKAGHFVKENRKIYISINRKSPPTLPLPNLFGEGNSGSLLNAEAVLKSNELKRGRIIYQRHPNRDLLIEIRMNGQVILPGIRIPKGSVIDLVVGDGAGASDFVMGNFVGMTYENALLRLDNLSLHLGSVLIPEGADTTDIISYVLKQSPAVGDSVSVGDPVSLWIGPKGYKIEEEENQ